MVQTRFARGAVGEESSFRDEYVTAYRGMLLARVLEDKLAGLYRSGKIHGGIFLGRGQEALSVATGVHLRKGDVYAPLIRDMAGRLAFGETVIDVIRTYLGSPLGPMRGRDGNIHRGQPRNGQLAMISHLGAMISVVNGVLLAHRLQGITGRIGAASIGDGGISTGAFHEGLNQAAVEKLPLVLVVCNNHYAYSTPNSRQFACKNLVDKAVGYGIEGHSLVGNDLHACLRVLGAAMDRTRQGHGPQMVVAELLRLCGHGEHDDANYVEPALKAAPFARDCLKVAEEYLVAHNWADQATLEAWCNEAAEQVESAIATVRREPKPDPDREDWNVYSSPLVKGPDKA